MHQNGDSMSLSGTRTMAFKFVILYFDQFNVLGMLDL